MRNKMDRLERLNENLEVLKEMYMDQNAFEIGKTGGRIQQNADLENQMAFYSRKEMMERAKKYEQAENGAEAAREMNDYEKELMSQFEQNDQEIDDMLDVVIN